MSELKLIAAVKLGDAEAVTQVLDEGWDVDQKDDYGWTALNWAAGTANTKIIQKLLEAGADIANVGLDLRNVYQIALAAANVESAVLLKQAADKVGLSFNMPQRNYCKAYVASQLKQFAEWPTELMAMDDEAVVFLHHDLVVTPTLARDKDVLFDTMSAAWQTFCNDELNFHLPDDLAWAAAWSAYRSADNHPN
ncbi:MAG: ankyrin repeat domain-containing protein [Methylococcaceae bacterium]|jgi:ankyrin repeat protein